MVIEENGQIHYRKVKIAKEKLVEEETRLQIQMQSFADYKQRARMYAHICKIHIREYRRALSRCQQWNSTGFLDIFSRYCACCNCLPIIDGALSQLSSNSSYPGQVYNMNPWGNWSNMRRKRSVYVQRGIGIK